MNKFIGIYSLFLQEDLFIECQTHICFLNEKTLFNYQSVDLYDLKKCLLQGFKGLTVQMNDFFTCYFNMSYNKIFCIHYICICKWKRPITRKDIDFTYRCFYFFII